MKIYGLQKTTLLDYPGHVAATIFTGGCNFRCPFCHNMNLVDLVDETIISEEEIFSFIDKRAGVLDGVCITGGEPTLNSDLEQFIEKIKDKNLLVKLDTNGTNPEIIKKLIDKKLIDYIAMDIKSSESEYGKAAGINANSDLVDKIKRSIEIIKNSGIEYEFRTTFVNGIHDENSVRGIGELIKGAKTYYLQSYVESEYVIDKNLSEPDIERIKKYREIIKEYVHEAEIRGVD